LRLTTCIKQIRYVMLHWRGHPVVQADTVLSSVQSSFTIWYDIFTCTQKLTKWPA